MVPLLVCSIDSCQSGKTELFTAAFITAPPLSIRARYHETNGKRLSSMFPSFHQRHENICLSSLFQFSYKKQIINPIFIIDPFVYKAVSKRGILAYPSPLIIFLCLSPQARYPSYVASSFPLKIKNAIYSPVKSS